MHRSGEPAGRKRRGHGSRFGKLLAKLGQRDLLHLVSGGVDRGDDNHFDTGGGIDGRDPHLLADLHELEIDLTISHERPLPAL